MLNCDLKRMLKEFFQDISNEAYQIQCKLQQIEITQVEKPDKVKPIRQRNRLEQVQGGRKPLSAFFQYMQERRPVYIQVMSNPELASVIGEEWRQMNEEQRKPYYDKYDQEKEAYRQQVDVNFGNNCKKLKRAQLPQSFDQLVDSFYLDIGGEEIP